MRTVWKIAFAFLIWPISVMAQAPPPPSQANPPMQSSPVANDSTPGLDTTTTPSPAPTPIRIPVLVQPPALLYFRQIKQPPIAPGHFTVFNLSAGYSVTNLAIPSSGRVALTGMDVSVAADGGRRIGAKLDLSYAFAPNVFKSGHRVDVLSYLFGPTFSVWNGNAVSAYAHVLAGGAKGAGPIPKGGGGGEEGDSPHSPLGAWREAVEPPSPPLSFCRHTHL